MSRDERILWVLFALLLFWLCRRRASIWLGAAGEVEGGMVGGGGGIIFGPGAGGAPGLPGAGGSGGGGGCCNRCGSAAAPAAPGDPPAAPPPAVPASCGATIPDPFGSIGGGCCYWTGHDWGWAPLNHPICTGIPGS